MNQTLRDPAALVRAGLVAPADLLALEAVAARYAVAVTPDISELIDAGDPGDPIARQFLPSAEELETRPEDDADPIGDAAHSPLPGLVHRYPDRVLLKPLHVCPVYCRFCFRREMVGPDGLGTLSEADLSRAVAYIAADPRSGRWWSRAAIRSRSRPGASTGSRRRSPPSRMSACCASTPACRWSIPAPSPTI